MTLTYKLNLDIMKMYLLTCWFIHLHVKTGNNDDFIAYVTFNGRRLQVFVRCI